MFHPPLFRQMPAALLLVPSLLLAQASPSDWKAEVLKARQQKDAEFRHGKTSPLHGLQRLSLEAGRGTGLRATETGVERVEGAAPVTVKQQGGKWLWCTPQADTPLTGGLVLDLGRFHVQAWPSAEQLTLLVFDPERPEAKAFKGLSYFTPDRAFAVAAILEPVRAARPITLTTTRNLTRSFTPYARLRFKLGGRPQTLTAYKSTGEDIMFIPFTDATTGKETYSVGRFLEIPVPKGTAFTLDFNAAFNPLCNYSSIWNCPIPPEENALEVPVEAGEKAYPLH